MMCRSNKFIALVVAFTFILSSLSLANHFQVNASQDSQSEKPQDKSKDKPQDKKPSKPENPDGPDLVLNADLVMLDVTVFDQANAQTIMNLAQKDFQVFEDKSPQEITFFSKDQVPVSVVFTIDTSGSMRAKLDTIIKASKNLVKDSKKGDEMAVIEFKESPELLCEFTADTQEVLDTLDGLVARSQTSMLDAIYLAADYAKKDSKNRRRALVVVTDGLDKENYYKFDEVVKHLQESDTQIYLIGFTQDLDTDKGLFKKSSKEKAEALLSKLAVETGGRAFFPKELAEVHTIGQQISTDLRTQYAIGYYSTNNKKDGTFRTVRVQVASPSNKKLVARTRSGYYAPTEDGSPAKQKP
ncbi:MAG: VWA domain-containing protein [Acidobacteriota bacterium]